MNDELDTLDELIQVLGLISTLAPDMEIDIENPMPMALKVVENYQNLQQRIEELEQEITILKGRSGTYDTDYYFMRNTTRQNDDQP